MRNILTSPELSPKKPTKKKQINKIKLKAQIPKVNEINKFKITHVCVYKREFSFFQLNFYIV